MPDSGSDQNPNWRVPWAKLPPLLDVLAITAADSGRTGLAAMGVLNALLAGSTGQPANVGPAVRLRRVAVAPALAPDRTGPGAAAAFGAVKAVVTTTPTVMAVRNDRLITMNLDGLVCLVVRCWRTVVDGRHRSQAAPPSLPTCDCAVHRSGSLRSEPCPIPARSPVVWPW